MPAKKHHVVLSDIDRHKAEVIARSYKHSERERNRAKILLLADTSRPEAAANDAAIEQTVGVCNATVEAVRRRFAGGGFDAAVFRREQTHRKARVLDGAAEAFLIATVCSAPPDGHKRWSLVLLRDHLIGSEYVDAVSHETVRQTLKKMNSNRG